MTAKADRAKEILDDPIFQESLENLRNEYRSHFEYTKLSDEEALEVRRMLFLTHRLEHHLEKIIADGELSDFRANEQEQPAFLGELRWPKKA